MTNGVLFRQGIIALMVLCAHPLFGGVVLDGSFGTHGSLPGPNFMIPANFGRQVGGNLFQSFSQFNLNSSQSATFTGPNNVHNILSRVTSGSPSSIDGTIHSDIQGANLFFMNPAGVLFGQHAQLDVSGSVAVTTANYLKLVGGGRFNANLGGGDVLTSAPVSAFGFLNSAPKGVSIVWENFEVPPLRIAPQKVFSAVAGDITLSGCGISGDGSRVNLVSVKSPGEVALDATNINSPVDVTQFTALGTIDLTHSAIFTGGHIGVSGGPVVIRAGDLYLLGSSSIQSQTNGSAPGDTIDIAASVSATFGDFSEVTTATTGSGTAGDIKLTAPIISIRGSLDATTYGDGHGGNITVHADHLTVIAAPGNGITTVAFGKGDGGDIIVTANSLLIDGAGSPFFLGINTTAERDNGGKAGNIFIRAGDLSIVAGGYISSDTFGKGGGGDVTVTANSLLIDGSGSDLFTGISADALAGTGNGGDLAVTVDGLFTIKGGAYISTDTYSRGKGGDLSVHAESLSIDGSASDFFTGISADALEGTGNAGNLTITVDQALRIVGGGEISASTSSRGNGGDVTVSARSIFIDNAGQPPDFTGIFAEALDGTGNGGDLAISAGTVLLENGGAISAESFTSAAAGSVHLSLGTLTMDTGSSISSANTGSGEAGSVMIDTTGPLKLKDGSSISSSSDLGDAGSIDIHSGGPVKLSGDSSITVSAGGNGGDIHITAPDLVYLLDSEISATAGGNGGSGTGGNITIDTQFIVLNNSLISANAAAGQGGNINLISDFLFNSNSSITATGTTNGTVNITAPALDLGSELITLPVSLLSAESQLQERCTALL
jgi:filamentous hemagglutinin family protein